MILLNFLLKCDGVNTMTTWLALWHAQLLRKEWYRK